MIKADFIHSDEGVDTAREEIVRSSILAIDLETTGLSPLISDVRLLQVATSAERCFIFDMNTIKVESLEFLYNRVRSPEVVKIFQNAKFDIKFLMRHFNWQHFPTIYDTYLASILISCGRQERHDLATITERFLKLRLNKELGKSDWSIHSLSQDQLSYAARDACILFPLRERENEFLKALDLERAALLEFDCVEAVASLELNGFYLNRNHWQTRVDEQTRQRDELELQIKKHFDGFEQTDLFGDTQINLDSPIKMLSVFQKLGCPLQSTAEDDLRPLADRFPVIKDFLKYREMSTAIKMFGLAYLDFVSTVDERIHANFRQIGTPTGRFTCAEPNLQQVPSKKIYRSSFQAQGDNKSLIIADYSMVELRIMAEFSRDGRLLDAFSNNIDLHQYTGAHAFGLPLESAAKGTQQRQIGKMLNFGTAYGAAAARFATISGLSVNKADEALKAFWGLYKGLDIYLKEAESRAANEREIHSYSGRTWKLDYDPADSKAVGYIKRTGRNFPIQATCSDIIKRALFFLRDASREKNIKIVNVVHDEIVCEADDGIIDEAKSLVSESMLRAEREVLTIVPAKVDVEVSNVWEK